MMDETINSEGTRTVTQYVRRPGLPVIPKQGDIMLLEGRWIRFDKIEPPLILYSEINWFLAQWLRFVAFCKEVK